MTTDTGGPDSWLAQVAYTEARIDPVTYAAEHVIQSHIDLYLSRWDTETTAVLSRRIVGDLLDAGWVPPQAAGAPGVTR